MYLFTRGIMAEQRNKTRVSLNLSQIRVILDTLLMFPHSLFMLKPKCSVLCLVTQLCQTLCNPMDCSLPGSSVHGEWVAMPSRRGSSQPRK